MLRSALFTLSIAATFCVSTASSQAPIRSNEELAARIAPLVSEHDGNVAVAIRHLEINQGYRYAASRPMPTASLIKLPVMVTAFQMAEQGQLDLAKKLVLRQSDKVPGSGILTAHFSPGTQITLSDCIRLMIVYSDNTATNMVVDQMGLKATAKHMESLDLKNTKLHSKVYNRSSSVFPNRSREFGLGSTTADEMVDLLARLHAEQLAKADSTKQMLDHLLACDDDTKIARHLPPGTRFAHKTGAISKARCDAGILYTKSGPVAVCVLTSNNKDQSWTSKNAANVLCGEIGRVIASHFGAVTDEPSYLANGATGKLVETLQRTLNVRLTPSPELSVDGDFGPNTEAAVQRFQRSKGLEPTGRVDSSTWKALGTLLESDKPVPAPESVNNEHLDREPQPPLSSPPIVTCKAWAIGDLDTGEILWESHAGQPLNPASTTKIMTAVIVLDLAKQDPSILEETTTFSRRADDTAGSTSGVRAGEQLPIHELLYGLLLPSGNDAAVALAEHFGARLNQANLPDTDDRESDDTRAASSYDQFIAAMNETAKRLQLTKTHFTNPHGLTDRRHKVSARDLVRLGTYAMQDARFREIVSTRQHGCTVTGEAGYRRNLLWKNTNKLLPIEGYLGLKTGTTSAAGACLVGAGERDDERLIIAVLGSASSPARYADIRNLFRWAWQRGER